MTVGVQELLIVGVALLVLLAVPARFPHLARQVGEGLREFRRIGKADGQ